MSIGEKIKRLRAALDLTQDDVAVAAGTTKQTIHKYEMGIISNIPASKIKAIADKLNTTPAYLMGWSEESSQDESNTTLYEIPIFEKYNRLNSVGQEKADIYITDLLDNPKYVAEQYQDDYASIAADTGKGGRVPAPSLDTIIELNKDNQ